MLYVYLVIIMNSNVSFKKNPPLHAERIRDIGVENAVGLCVERAQYEGGICTIFSKFALAVNNTNINKFIFCAMNSCQ